MNRLAAPFAPHATFSASNLDFSAGHASTSVSAPASRGVFARRQRREAAPGVALFAPIHYERRYAYPLLVWLHGDGSSERELRQLMPLVSLRNYVGVAARGVAACVDSTSSDPSGGHAWLQTPAAIDAASDRVWECIDLAKQRFNIHEQRIFLAGHGAGGTMALRLALQLPLPIAGAISLNGPVPRGNCPLARVNVARRLPLLLMACSESQRYTAPQVADDLRLLHSAGFSLALRQYLCGDELFSDMFADMDHWLMERVCGAPTTKSA
jgi:phospholipase/carboxylesterase